MTSRILPGDARTVLDTLPAESVDSIVTSPPYWQARDYGAGQGEIGQEAQLNDYALALLDVFRECHRVLKRSGTCFVVLGDAYNGSGYSNHSGTGARSREQGGRKKHLSVHGRPNKSMLSIPQQFGLLLGGNQWLLRAEIIWQKPNPLPQPSVKDRPWTAHEYIYLFTRQQTYYYQQHPAYRDSVWPIPYGRQDKGVDHPAVFPVELARACIIQGCPPGGHVLDPFCGSGTTGIAALRLGCSFTGVDLNPVYCRMAEARLANVAPGQRIGNAAQLPLPEEDEPCQR